MKKIPKLTITIIMININIIIYFYQIYLKMNDVNSELLFVMDLGISQNGSVKTIITNLFIHANFVHLGMNMLGLYFLGSYIEKNMNEKKYFILYFSAGLMASLLSIIYVSFVHNEIVIGASGAIFGLWSYYSLYRKEMNSFLIFGVASNVIMIILKMPIAWYAHLGGAIVGIFFFYLERKKTKLYKL